MVLYNHLGQLKKYNSPEEILEEFYEIRLCFYEKRKAYLMDVLEKEATKLQNQVKFIDKISENKIKLANNSKEEMIHLLQNRKYETDPLKKAKKTQKNILEEKEEEDYDIDKEDSSYGQDYHYLLNMPLCSLNKEKKKNCKKML
ncbi:DNA topoisomerase 2-alpha [Araneus ventricosus]|uniref:DNA topoisomerase (ATP-hydrolyzing) n=1 Tax=Araneus ventricosus TaxID=182803 RepID=A0A4Y2MBV7_ARAVE|nr:DNA topoisomerase 2-alpha [Araneus ventricosus]